MIHKLDNISSAESMSKNFSLNGLDRTEHGSASNISKMVNTLYEPADELHKDSKNWALIFVTLGVPSFLIFPTRSYFFVFASEKLIKSE